MIINKNQSEETEKKKRRQEGEDRRNHNEFIKNLKIKLNRQRKIRMGNLVKNELHNFIVKNCKCRLTSTIFFDLIFSTI